jgi:hypothetical protein
VRFNRLFWFLISILVGTGLGLLYGWMINPVRYVNTTPQSLRDDYKADYVLMTAEIYVKDKDLNLARRRLALLGDQNVLRTVQRAILKAQAVGYSAQDMQLMGVLAQVLEGPAGPQTPTKQTTPPLQKETQSGGTP